MNIFKERCEVSVDARQVMAHPSQGAMLTTDDPDYLLPYVELCFNDGTIWAAVLGTLEASASSCMVRLERWPWSSRWLMTEVRLEGHWRPPYLLV